MDIETVRRLAAQPPPKKKWIMRAADINAEIIRLENALKIEHALPIFNLGNGNARIEQLRLLLEQASASAPLPAASAAVVVPDIAAQVSDPATTAAQFMRLDAASRKSFLAAGGTMDYAEFGKLNPALKSLFCTHGGRLTGKVQNGRSPLRS